MGFFNLQVTVIGSASTADMSTITRPSFFLPSVSAISTRVWLITRSNPTSVALIGHQGNVQTLKKGCRSTPKSWFWTVNPLIRYQDLTPQTLPPNHPQG